MRKINLIVINIKPTTKTVCKNIFDTFNNNNENLNSSTCIIYIPSLSSDLIYDNRILKTQK